VDDITALILHRHHNGISSSRLHCTEDLHAD